MHSFTMLHCAESDEGEEIQSNTNSDCVSIVPPHLCFAALLKNTKDIFKLNRW